MKTEETVRCEADHRSLARLRRIGKSCAAGSWAGEATYIARAILHLFVDENDGSSRLRAPEFFTHDNTNISSSSISQFIYPNPASDKVSIQLLGPVSENIHIFIKDVFGREILRKNIGKASIINISTESWVSGIYIVDLYDKDDFIGTDKLIVSHY